MYFEDDTNDGSRKTDKTLIYTFQQNGYDSGLFVIATAELMHNQPSVREKRLDISRHINQNLIDTKNMRYVLATLILYFNEDDYPSLFCRRLKKQMLETTKQSSSTTLDNCKNQVIQQHILQVMN